jgi:outer membrane protein
MKKVTVLITLFYFFAFSTSEAQINRGRSLIGVSTSFSYINYGSDLMSLGFSSIKSKGNNPANVDPDVVKVTTLNLSPKFGFFIVNNLVLGINVSFGTSVDKPESGGKSTSATFGLGPFVRYYINGSKVMPFFEVSSLFGSISQKYEDPLYSSSNKSRISSIGGGAGLAVKLGEKATFDLMAGYNSISEKALENNPNDNRTVQGTIAFKLGFTILLGSN